MQEAGEVSQDPVLLRPKNGATVVGDVTMIREARKQPSSAQDLFVYTRAAPGWRFEQPLWLSICVGHDKPLFAPGRDDERLLGNAFPVSDDRRRSTCARRERQGDPQDLKPNEGVGADASQPLAFRGGEEEKEQPDDAILMLVDGKEIKASPYQPQRRLPNRCIRQLHLSVCMGHFAIKI